MILVVKASIIPLSSEKFVSMTINSNIVFIDSMKFMTTSLEKLVSQLRGIDEEKLKADKTIMRWPGDERFKVTRQFFDSWTKGGNNKTFEQLLRKGVYPYDFVKKAEDFNHQTLPTQDQFFNKLKMEKCADTEYIHAQNVWNNFGCDNMGDFHDLYCGGDSAQVADVFENLRKKFWDEFRLDAA